MIIIRLATEHDISDLVKLSNQLGYENDGDSIRRALDYHNNAPYHAVFIAKEESSSVIGFLSIAGMHHFVAKQLKFRITSLVVDASYRKRGIGKTFLQHAEKFAMSHNGCLMELTSSLYRKKDGAHDFYQKHGYANNGDKASLYLKKLLS